MVARAFVQPSRGEIKPAFVAERIGVECPPTIYATHLLLKK